MIVEEALKKILTDDNGVNALISGRVYPVVLPQKPTFPAVTYQKVAGGPDMTLKGPNGKAHPRFQIDAWASTYGAAKGLATAVRVALNGKKFTVNSVVIGSVTMLSDRDLYEAEIFCHRVSMDFSIWHNQ